MFNKNKKSFLVIEKNTYFPKEETFRVSKSANSLDEAIGYKLALEKLNDRDNQFYFIATDMETANSTMIDHHNKSVEVA